MADKQETARTSGGPLRALAWTTGIALTGGSTALIAFAWMRKHGI